MAYVKKDWKIKDFQKGDDELVDSLNHMEQGIADGGQGSGTQLYKHYFDVEPVPGTHWQFYIINDISTPYTNLTDLDTILDGKFWSSTDFYHKILGIINTPSGYRLVILNYQSSISVEVQNMVELTGLTDTVIEL